MATRNTKQDAQEMIDFVISKRPQAEFKITEINYTRGNGQKAVLYEVFEKSICAKCGEAVWHIDYGNDRVEHTDCEISAEKKFNEELAERIAEQDKRNAVLNYIAETDD